MDLPQAFSHFTLESSHEQLLVCDLQGVGESMYTDPQIHSFDFASAAILLNLASQGAGDVALARVCDAVEEHPWQRLSFSKASMTGREVPRPD